MKRLLYPFLRILAVGILIGLFPALSHAQVNVNDSLALVQLYQQTAGDDWLDNSNWLSGPVSTWFGITVDPGSQRVVDIQLRQNNLQGGVPVDLLNLDNLQAIDIAENFIESIPDFSLLPNIMAMEISDNLLQFDDLEPIDYQVFNFFNYSPQKPVGIARDTIAKVGTLFELDIPIGGVANQYIWLKDGQPINPSIPFITSLLTFDPVVCTDQGLYQLAAFSEIVPDLTIGTEPILLNTVGVDSLGAPYRCNQIIVQWDSSATDMEKDTMRTFFSATYLDSVLCGNIELWGLPDTVFLSSGDSLFTIEEIVSKTKEKSKIEEVDLNYLADIEHFTSTHKKQHLKPLPYFSYLAPPPASADTVLAAIIDTGVDSDHDALEDYIWFNEDEFSDLTDTDGNCLPDDFNGFDFIEKQTSIEDRNGHGSHVGGLMLEGLAPMAEDVDLIVLRTHDEFGGGDIFRIISAIYYATSKGAEVINISSGYSGGIAEILGNAIEDARVKNGTIVVCSAGNRGINNDTLSHYPSSFPFDNILSVGALNVAEDSIAVFSNYGQTSVDLFAPGSVILSAVLDNEVDVKSGTSMSAGIVSNAVILMKQAYPIASYQEITSCLLSTATEDDDLDTLAVTGAKLNLMDALLCISTILNVEEIEFKAERQEDHLVKLDWRITANEYPKRFQVQRLFHNGPGFETIGTVERADLQFEFEYLDPDLHLGKLYYRLQWEDEDGQVYYSEVQAIEALKGEQFMHVYPNPSTGQVNLELNGLSRNTEVQIEVIDPLGQILHSKGHRIQPGSVLNLQFDHLPAGYYQLRMTQGQENFSVPLMLMPR